MNILTELRMSLNPVRICLRPSDLVRMVSFVWRVCNGLAIENHSFDPCHGDYLAVLDNGIVVCVTLWLASFSCLARSSPNRCLLSAGISAEHIALHSTSVPGGWLNNQFVVCKFANAIFRVSCCMLASCRSVFLFVALSWLHISVLTLTAFRSLQFSCRPFVFSPKPFDLLRVEFFGPRFDSYICKNCIYFFAGGIIIFIWLSEVLQYRILRLAFAPFLVGDFISLGERFEIVAI